MKWLLVMMLITPQGRIHHTEVFDYSYQCETRLASLITNFPGSSGGCSHP